MVKIARMNFGSVLKWSEVTSLSAAITFVVGVAAASVVTRKKSALTAIAGIFVKMPIYFPPSVLALFFALLCGRTPSAVAALHSTLSSLPLAVLIGALLAFPVVYHIAYGTFRRIDGALLDTARVYGLPAWRALLPLARGGLALAAFCSFARAFAELGILALIVRQEFFVSSEDGCPSFAVALFLTIVVTVVSLITLWKQYRWRCC